MSKFEHSHPNWKGSCKIAGIEYWVSEWEGETKGGKPIRNIKFTEIKKAHDEGIAKVKKEVSLKSQVFTEADLDKENFSDDIPF
jgi:hypothetical protein